MRHERYRFKPVRRLYIPKKDGKQRPLGLPSWSDKLVGEVVRLLLEAYYEPQFSEHSHGYRPRRGCHTALREVARTWTGTTWFIEGDISQCFDRLDHQVMLQKLGEKIHDTRLLRLIGRMLQAGYLEDWVWNATLSGAPQGGAISPLLANLMLHYAFDTWMARTFPAVPFERYCDDIIVHARSERQALQLRAMIASRLAGCGLELNEHKTRIVYCKDDDRRGFYEHTSFDFLSYTFQPRLSKNRFGKHFLNFTPAVSSEAKTRMRREMRRWRVNCRSDKTLTDLA